MIAICRDGTEDGVILMYWNQGRILVKIVGEVETIFGGVQKFSRVVQNDLRGGTHLPSKSGHDWKNSLLATELERRTQML
jgi:hypothetical protein